MSQTQSSAIVLASTEVAARIGMEKGTMLEAFKVQCFRNANNVSDSQLAAFVSIARDIGVNPLLPGMLYAYPTTNGGIVPMMGPDGVYKKLGEHPRVAGWQTKVFPEDGSGLPTHATTTVFVKDSEYPIEYTAYFSEWKVSSNPNWSNRPRHMLGLRSLKQAARQVIHGLPYDEDDKTIGDLINVTPGAEPEKQERTAPKKREQRGVAAVAENPPAESSKATESAIEVPATPVTEAPANPPAPVVPAEVVAPAAEAPKADPKPVTPANNAPVVLEDGKEITVEGIIVERFVEKDINKVAKSIQAEVSGPYAGTVYHLGGACPAWQIEKPVTLRLLGKKLKSGAIAGMVQSIEITAASVTGGETIE